MIAFQQILHFSPEYREGLEWIPVNIVWFEVPSQQLVSSCMHQLGLRIHRPVIRKPLPAPEIWITANLSQFLHLRTFIPFNLIFVSEQFDPLCRLCIG